MDREIYDRMQVVEGHHWWFVARREILADQIARAKLPPHADILEVGCGTGGNLEMLTRFGHVRAIEPDDAARIYASRNGADVRDGRMPDGLPTFGVDFDLVAAFDVIEHIDEDAASVAKLATLLKPGGCFIATVPANRWMWSRHDERHHHKRRYDRDGFRRLFESAGLTVTRATYFNTLLYPLIALVRLIKRAGGDDSSDDEMPAKTTNAVLRRLFAFEKALLSRFELPFGVSILLIAERPA